MFAEVFAESHAIPFWQGLLGEKTGWIWSLALEGVALWLMFFNGRIQRMVGLLAAVCIIAVPLWQITKPVVPVLKLAVAQKAKVHSAEAGLQNAKASEKHTQALTLARKGWAGELRRAITNRKQAEAVLQTLEHSAPVSIWEALVPLIPLAGGLLLFQFTNLQAVFFLRQNDTDLLTQNDTDLLTQRQNDTDLLTQNDTELLTQRHNGTNLLTQNDTNLLTQNDTAPQPVMGDDIFTMRKVVKWLRNRCQEERTWTALAYKLKVGREEICYYVNFAEGSPNTRRPSAKTKQALYLAFIQATASHPQAAAKVP